MSLQAQCLALARNNRIAGAESERTSCFDAAPGLGSSIRAALHRIYLGVAYQAANLSEFESSFETSGGETRDDREFHWPLKSLHAMPMVVLTAERHPAPVPGFSPNEQARFWAAWKAGHDHLATLSTSARNVVVQGSGHFIQDDRPTVVTAWIMAVVNAVRTGGTLRPSTG